VAKTKTTVKRMKADKSLIAAEAFENETIWLSLALCWKMFLAARVPFSEAIDFFWDSKELQNWLGLSFPTLISTRKARRKRMEERMNVVLRHVPAQGNMGRNLQGIAELFQLDSDQVTLLRFAVLIQTSATVRCLVDLFCDGMVEEWEGFSEFAAQSLDLPLPRFLELVAENSLMVRTGLLEVDPTVAFSNEFVSTPKSLARRLRTGSGDLVDIIKESVDISQCVELGQGDFAHLGALWGALTNALQADPPAHVLLAGAPGTGKTQLALALCKACGRTAGMVKTENKQGGSLEGGARRDALILGSKLIASMRDPVLIVDEAENLLDANALVSLADRRSPNPSKAWLNRFLENAEVPTIWIVNDPQALDPSVLRRFTWIVPIAIPPRSTRQRIWTKSLAEHGLSESFLEELSYRSDLPPYEATRLARIANMAGEHREEHVRLALGLADRLLERKPLSALPPPTVFDPALLNIDADLPALLTGLSRSGHGRLGFFGPPGTGKTMLAGEIARHLDRTLLVKSGSDLLGSYVGETEKNIASAFQEAMDENAVLLLDEIDGMAGDRSQARHAWERTQTNEILVRLEAFRGIVILATNFVETLDPALARRLDVKVMFKPLHPTQAWQLFQARVPESCEGLKTRLQGMELRLGDFSASLRRLAACGAEVTGPALLDALQAELVYRPGMSRKLGL
jgi:AAA+ superfamily predicted ATPase